MVYLMEVKTLEIYKKILENNLFKIQLNLIEKAEADRVFCCHGMNHLLDLARIAMLINQEQKLELSKDIIYSTALLHDLGRGKEYEDGTPHDIAGVELAKNILFQCNATQELMDTILFAISRHRGQDKLNEIRVDLGEREQLASLIKRADKLSRPCFNCKAINDCKWPDDKKNWTIIY